MSNKLTIILLFTVHFLMGQDASIIMSPIGPQVVYEDARITVYFSTLKHFEGIDFEIADLPDFATLSYDPSGSGQIIFDPQSGDEGLYTLHIDATSGDLSNTTAFNLNVLPIDESSATIFYIDPEIGDDNATGTEEDPFRTLTEFLVTKHSLIDDNTYLFLKSGFHGSPVFTGTKSNPVKILAAAGHTPRVKKLNFSFTTNWYVSGLDVSPQNDNKTDTETLINIFAGSKYIEISNCKIYPIEDASVWTTNEMWYEGSGNGILSSGTECLFRNNFLKNTWFSVEMRKQYNEFSYNIIDWFGADAIRAIASNQTVNYNQVKNATVYDYDHPTRPQHDDGIQSWTFNNPVKNIQIIGNQVVDIADPNLPLKTEIMQGIVDFDGFAEDWEVTNNLVVTHHAHGIALYGAKNCNVSNNTVTRNPFNLFFPNFKPWIRINPRKVDVGGDHSFGNLVRNNIMSTYEDENLEPATKDHNIITTSYTSIYADYDNWDFHLASDSPAIDIGNDRSTPSIDQEGKLRNVDLPDAGCFEKNATITDRESPTMPSNIQFTSDQTEINLEWDDSEDNTDVSHYEITINETISYTSKTSNIQLTRLEPDQAYDIEVIAVDFFGNASQASMTSASTIVEELMTVHYISAYRHDQLIKSNMKLMWVGMPSLAIGDYDNGADATAVIPFQLPCIDVNKRNIVDADLEVFLEEINETPTGEVDAYLVEMRPKSDVLQSDYYQGLSSEATSGMLIAEDFLDNESSGTVSLDADQRSNLGTQIRDLYDTGACNKFAFIRLNSNVSNEEDNSFYSISSSDNKNSDQRPLLKIVSIEPTSTYQEEVESGIDIMSNPIIGNSITFRKNDNFGSEKSLLEIHNSQGQKVYSKLIPPHEDKIRIEINISAGVYYATILGKEKYSQVKFIKL